MRGVVRLDAGSLDTGGKLRADLLCQLWGYLATEERGDLLRLYAQHRFPGELLIQRPQCRGRAEHHVGGIFHLHQAPVVSLAEDVEHRAAHRGIPVEYTVQLVRRELVSQVLRAFPVGDAGEGVVGRGEGDALRGQLTCQPAVTVAVELQPKWRPA